MPFETTLRDFSSAAGSLADAAQRLMPGADLDFRQMVEQAEVGICITQDGRFQYVNPKFAQMHGLVPQDLVGTDYARVVHPDARAHVAEVRRLRDAGQHHAAYKSRNLHRDGSGFDTRIFGRAIVYGGRQANLVTMSDITEQAEAQAQLERLVNYHPVTGLASRALLLERARAALSVSLREDRPLAMLYIRVAHLDRVYDALGLAAGDALTIEVAFRIAASCREGDTTAQLGNGEFAILLDPLAGADESHALTIATRIASALDMPTVVGATEVFTGGHVGIAQFPADATSADKLLEYAHSACGSGDARIHFFTRQAAEKATRRLRLEAGLRRAFERSELSLAYQPQLDLRTGRVVGVEALLRWHSEEFGHVSPGEFVPIAEEIGLIVTIGEWVFRSACEQSVAWARAGLAPVRIGVNLSPRQLEQIDISQRLQSVLLQTGADPTHLGVEVTESVLMRDIDHCRRTLEELAAIGIEIALDDFGTGYSNLGVLRALPFHVLKIDRSLVHDVTAAPEDVSITRAVLALAQGLKIKVLAEGVETEGQLNLLIGNGCDLMQGFIFSRPLPAADIEAMLREGKCLPQSVLRRAAKQHTLLLVDDEDNVLSSLRRLLRTEGYKIVIARSGPEGMAALAEHDVDVIISDQRMPGMTGVEFLRRAKELYPETIRMVLSGYTELQSITDAVNEGAIYKFLTKPWDDARLREHVREAFRRKELSDENRRLADEVRAANAELALANARQEQILTRQREQLSLDECRALNSQDLLEMLPTPVIGLDADGCIAFVNHHARRLMAPAQALVGCTAGEVLPAAWREAWQQADGQARSVWLNGHRHLLSCTALDERTTARGHLLTITPCVDTIDANSLEGTSA